jgi:hypothetical protein
MMLLVRRRPASPAPKTMARFSSSWAACWLVRTERMMNRAANMPSMANAGAVKGTLRGRGPTWKAKTRTNSTTIVARTVRATSLASSKEPRSCPTA